MKKDCRESSALRILIHRLSLGVYRYHAEEESVLWVPQDRDVATPPPFSMYSTIMHRGKKVENFLPRCARYLDCSGDPIFRSAVPKTRGDQIEPTGSLPPAVRRSIREEKKIQRSIVRYIEMRKNNVTARKKRRKQTIESVPLFYKNSIPVSVVGWLIGWLKFSLQNSCRNLLRLCFWHVLMR